MAASNATVAQLLERYAAALSAAGVDRFKVKAYRRAGQTIEHLPQNVGELVASGGDLKTLPGVGTAISGVIEEIVRTGTLGRLDETLSRMSPEMAELAGRPQLDPKRVLRIYKTLGIHSLKELQARLESGTVGEAFDARMEMHVRQGLDPRPRLLLRKADQIAGEIESFLQGLAGVETIARTGSLRRRQETVGDLSFLISGADSRGALSRFAQLGSVEKNATRPDSRDSKGTKSRVMIRLASGQLSVLTRAPKKEWGLRMLEETGSVAHLRDLQARARKRRLVLSAKALAARRIDADDESKIYEALGLPWIEPELREGRGEVTAAAEGQLPTLLTLADLKGDLHMHTVASDGANSIAEMAEAARARGYQYIAITDHSQSLKLTNGLSERRLLEQIRQIDKLNERLEGIHILKSSEVDILEDGSLDYPKRLLKELDLTICSIHSKFSLDRRQQTERVLRAMDNPFFNILGHATGRLLLKRPGYEIEIERLVDHAKACGCFFEINANPNRLDLSDLHAKEARDRGVKIAINTDAHSIHELDFMAGGVDQARRAWLESKDVLNAASLPRLRKILKR